jgi:hypothetical protein
MGLVTITIALKIIELIFLGEMISLRLLSHAARKKLQQIKLIMTRIEKINS